MAASELTVPPRDKEDPENPEDKSKPGVVWAASL